MQLADDVQVATSAGLLATALGWALVSVSLIVAASAELAITLGAAGVTIACVGAMLLASVSRGRDESSLFRYSYPIVLAIYYGIASFGWVSGVEIPELTRRVLQREAIVPAFIVVMVGVSAWLVGYLGGGRFGIATLSRLRDQALPARTRWSLPGASAVVTVYLLGAAGRFIALAQGSFGYISRDVVAATTTSSPLLSLVGKLEALAAVGALMATFLVARSPSLRHRLLLWGIVASELLFGLLSGMRSEVVLLFVSIGAVMWQLRGRPSLRSVAALAAVVVVLVPFMAAYRETVRDGNRTEVTTSEAVGLIPSLLVTTLVDVSPSDAIATPTDFVLDRFRGIDGVAIVRQRTPSEIPYVSIEQTFAEPILGLIPRVVWHNKPVYTTGLDYAREYLGQSRVVVSASTPTQIGDLYRRGGVVAVAVGMALVGALCRVLARVLRPRRDPRVVLLAVPILLALANMDSDFLILPLAVIQTALLTGVACRVVFRATSAPPARHLSGLGLVVGSRSA